jgi:two-component system phosphate regulon sensor histidine kinase PhoR
MKRSWSEDGAPISLILALVFPAMIAAALALAYYGFQYADSMSRPIEQLFHEISREEAEKVVSAIETKVDRGALEFFGRIASEKAEPRLPDPCHVEAGPLIESYVVLNARRATECEGPRGTRRPRKASLGAAQLKVLNWDAVKPGSHHHYHELLADGSTLIVYTVREDEAGRRYYVAARVALDLVTDVWLKEALAQVGKNYLEVAIVDVENSIVAGARAGAPGAEAPFSYKGSFGQALYRWRIHVVARNTDEFRAEAQRRKVLGPLLIILSTVIIAVGLGIVWLAVRAERRASRLKSDFIANVSHELKTPLSLVRMFGELVASGRHKGEVAAREYGAIITRESERLSHLIDNVLDFARLERGKASYDFAEGDVADLVERALEICRYRIEKEKLKLRTRIEPGLPPVRMDENALTLVILNLVDNAIKYAADGGEIEVSLGRVPGGVQLEVRDFGPGIARDEISRVFERFYRARTARDRNVRGSGIGLALVRHIAEAHGGRVTVESGEPAPRAGVQPAPRAGVQPAPHAGVDVAPRGQGCAFRVFLPAPVAEGVGVGSVTGAGEAGSDGAVAATAGKPGPLGVKP